MVGVDVFYLSFLSLGYPLAVGEVVGQGFDRSSAYLLFVLGEVVVGRYSLFGLLYSGSGVGVEVSACLSGGLLGG